MLRTEARPWTCSSTMMRCTGCPSVRWTTTYSPARRMMAESSSGTPGSHHTEVPRNIVYSPEVHMTSCSVAQLWWQKLWYCWNCGIVRLLKTRNGNFWKWTGSSTNMDKVCNVSMLPTYFFKLWCFGHIRSALTNHQNLKYSMMLKNLSLLVACTGSRFFNHHLLLSSSSTTKEFYGISKPLAGFDS